MPFSCFNGIAMCSVLNETYLVDLLKFDVQFELNCQANWTI